MQLLEFCQTDSCTTAAAGVIRGVVILGAKSKNGREYSVRAMRAAVPLYEGVKVFVDHPVQSDYDRKGRSADDRFGQLKNVRFVESEKKLRGDLVYLTGHPLAERVAEDLRRDTKFFGLSHLANGTGRQQADGTMLIESIDGVKEVDLVTGSATTAGLMEAELQFSEQSTFPTDPRKVAAALRRDEPQAVHMSIGRTSQRQRVRRTVEEIPTSPIALANWLRR